ncbi:hypothetical protein FA13DRAFT_1797391 [Coprinellus micaceus]|uniref:Uncharacterized protein n=1 Tax=Coprinellus micaceus TaxID=71717 RepID=A0A4Y7SQN8_COPMI|nr:hypothetical protein FA13DRAFT_1797391 [Coprinellus micaceus]
MPPKAVALSRLLALLHLLNSEVASLLSERSNNDDGSNDTDPELAACVTQVCRLFRVTTDGLNEAFTPSAPASNSNAQEVSGAVRYTAIAATVSATIASARSTLTTAGILPGLPTTLAPTKVGARPMTAKIPQRRSNMPVTPSTPTIPSRTAILSTTTTTRTTSGESLPSFNEVDESECPSEPCVSGVDDDYIMYREYESDEFEPLKDGSIWENLWSKSRQRNIFSGLTYDEWSGSH